jgi:hypothetical protein
MIAIENSLGLWIPQVTGRYINEDWNPENEGFGAQCWDTAASWSKYLGLPVISTGGKGRWPGWAGNMVDAFPQSAAIAAAYELIGPDEPGHPGDIPVWGDSYYYYPKTHVAVLVRDLGAQLLCISQNSSASRADNPYPGWTKGPTILQHLPRSGLIGFIRPRTGGTLSNQSSTTTTSEEDDMDQNTVFTSKDGAKVTFQDYLISLDKKLEGTLNRVDSFPKFNEQMREQADIARAFYRDARADLAQKAAQNTALLAAVSALANGQSGVSTESVLAAIESAVSKFTAAYQLALVPITTQEGK